MIYTIGCAAKNYSIGVPLFSVLVFCIAVPPMACVEYLQKFDNSIENVNGAALALSGLSQRSVQFFLVATRCDDRQNNSLLQA